jgi:hypothetical protein
MEALAVIRMLIAAALVVQTLLTITQIAQAVVLAVAVLVI